MVQLFSSILFSIPGVLRENGGAASRLLMFWTLSTLKTMAVVLALGSFYRLTVSGTPRRALTGSKVANGVKVFEVMAVCERNRSFPLHRRFRGDAPYFRKRDTIILPRQSTDNSHKPTHREKIRESVFSRVPATTSLDSTVCTFIVITVHSNARNGILRPIASE